MTCVSTSHLKHGDPTWKRGLRTQKNRNALDSGQSECNSAVYITPGMIPICLTLREDERVYTRRREGSVCRSHTSRRVLHYYPGMAGTMGLCREWSMDLPTHPEHPTMICEKTQGDGFPSDNSCRDMVTLGRISIDFGLRRRLDTRNVSCPKLQNMWCLFASDSTIKGKQSFRHESFSVDSIVHVC